MIEGALGKKIQRIETTDIDVMEEVRGPQSPPALDTSDFWVAFSSALGAELTPFLAGFLANEEGVEVISWHCAAHIWVVDRVSPCCTCYCTVPVFPRILLHHYL